MIKPNILYFVPKTKKGLIEWLSRKYPNDKRKFKKKTIQNLRKIYHIIRQKNLTL
jgi:hypothetical protein